MEKILNKNKVFEMLHCEKFMYKGKTITLRTVRTMFDNGFFKSKEWSNVFKCWTVAESEVLEKIEDQK